MKLHSQAWLASINQIREESWGIDHLPRTPVVPSITPPLHPKLRALFQNIGKPRALGAGERIFSADTPIDQIALTAKGITARELGQGLGCNPMGIAPPGRIACGNLNFYSSHSCIGSYFALVPSEVILVSKSLLKGIFRKDPELSTLFAINAELCALSDRLTFAAMSMLPAEDRIRAFFIGWAASYAVLRADEQESSWLVMPATIQRRFLERAVNASHASLESTLRNWRAAGLLRRLGSNVWLRPALLEPCHQWMLSLEEPSEFHRPKRLLDFWRAAPGRFRSGPPAAWSAPRGGRQAIRTTSSGPRA